MAAAPAPVFLNIRHRKTTLCLDALETTPIYEVKRIVEGIMKRAPEEQKLLTLTGEGKTVLNDGKTLKDYGITHDKAGPHEPFTVALVLKNGETFESVQIDYY